MYLFTPYQRRISYIWASGQKGHWQWRKICSKNKNKKIKCPKQWRSCSILKADRRLNSRSPVLLGPRRLENVYFSTVACLGLFRLPQPRVEHGRIASPLIFIGVRRSASRCVCTKYSTLLCTVCVCYITECPAHRSTDSLVRLLWSLASPGPSSEPSSDGCFVGHRVISRQKERERDRERKRTYLEAWTRKEQCSSCFTEAGRKHAYMHCTYNTCENEMRYLEYACTCM